MFHSSYLKVTEYIRMGVKLDEVYSHCPNGVIGMGCADTMECIRILVAKKLSFMYMPADVHTELAEEAKQGQGEMPLIFIDRTIKGGLKELREKFPDV